MGQPEDDTRATWSSADRPAADEVGGSSPAAPAEDPTPAQIASLRQQLAECQDRFLRERAESENFKKRLQREKAEDLKFATEPLLRDLLPVVDNLERALEYSASAAPPVREGIELVLKSLLAVLERHNVKRVEAHGQPFDPAFHQAIAQIESAAHAPASVVEQHQVGYTLNERLIRPAVVTVNAPKSRADGVESE